MTSYKLVYFKARGRAEVSRFIFAQAGVRYEDKRVEKEEWLELKPNTPTGQLPMLEVDGKQLAGSGPIARFLGERFGLAGTNDFENAEIASVVDVLYDIFLKFIGFYLEKDEEKKENLKKQLEDVHIPNYFGILDKRFSADGWLYGDKPTYADFILYNVSGYLIKVFPDFYDKHPGVLKSSAAVEALPNIAKWLKERPVTEN